MLLFMLSLLLLLFTDIFFSHLFAQGIDADIVLFMNKSLISTLASTIKKIIKQIRA